MLHLVFALIELVCERRWRSNLYLAIFVAEEMHIFKELDGTGLGLPGGRGVRLQVETCLLFGHGGCCCRRGHDCVTFVNMFSCG